MEEARYPGFLQRETEDTFRFDRPRHEEAGEPIGHSTRAFQFRARGDTSVDWPWLYEPPLFSPSVERLGNVALLFLRVQKYRALFLLRVVDRGDWCFRMINWIGWKAWCIVWGRNVTLGHSECFRNRKLFLLKIDIFDIIRRVVQTLFDILFIKLFGKLRRCLITDGFIRVFSTVKTLKRRSFWKSFLDFND